MDSIRLQREHQDNALQHSALSTDIPKMVETGQVKVVADSTTSRHTGKWVSKTQYRTFVALISLSLLGIYTIGIHSITSGLFGRIGEAAQSEFSPSGLNKYRHVFTGLKPLDDYLKAFAPFFEPLGRRVDDSSYLFWVWMIPQFGVTWALVMMENLRGGPGKETYLRTTILGLAIQHLGFAIALPLYLTYLTTSGPLARHTGPHSLTIPLRITSRHLLILPISLALGYFLPTLLMMLPHPLITSHTRQLHIVIWQFFPFYTVSIQAGLNAFAEWAEVASHGRIKDDKLKSEEAKTVRYLYDARTVYLMAFAVTTISHLNVLAICLFPEWLTAQFPFGLFSGVSFSSVFVPHLPTLGYRCLNLIEGVHSFLHWDAYIGGAAMLVYIGNMARNSEKAGWDGERGMKFWINMVVYTVVSGPAGAAAMGMWERDQRVIEQLVQEAKEWKEEEKMIKSQ